MINTKNSNSALRSERNISLGYLKAIIIIMMIAFHASLAYLTFLPQRNILLLAESRLWEPFPIIDTVKSAGLTIYMVYFDSFAMSLMFFISGLFVWKSIHSKGGISFLRGRFLRLGLPFIIFALFLSPLAYYPTYLSISTMPTVTDFCRQWLSLNNWPVGHLWFLWLLLVFDAIALFTFFLMQKLNISSMKKIPDIIFHPAGILGFFTIISAAALIPMILIFGPIKWVCFGPFNFQLSRLLHYGSYFMVGIIIGAIGIDNGFLTPGGRLARRWAYWLVISFIIFFIHLSLSKNTLTFSNLTLANKMFFGFFAVLTCVVTSFAFLALLTKFVRNRNRIFDSLDKNAYGMFLVHYGFVSWIQYALLGMHISAVSKGFIVFACALLLSWGTSSIFRRIPAIARIV